MLLFVNIMLYKNKPDGVITRSIEQSVYIYLVAIVLVITLRTYSLLYGQISSQMMSDNEDINHVIMYPAKHKNKRDGNAEMVLYTFCFFVIILSHIFL